MPWSRGSYIPLAGILRAFRVGLLKLECIGRAEFVQAIITGHETDKCYLRPGRQPDISVHI